jgi:hypothetical protein
MEACLKKLFWIAAALSPSVAFAEDGLTVSGSSRFRYELIEGQPRAGFNTSDDLLNIRTIFGVGYRAGNLHLRAEIYDSRAYGGNAGTPISTNEVNTLEPVQAYIAYEVPGAFGAQTKLALQAGRFMLNLGSRRLVAADDYRNTTNGYTGLRADLSLPHKMTATLIYTMPQVRLPDARADLSRNKVQLDRESGDLVLWGGVLTKKLNASAGALEMTYLHLGERDSAKLATRDRSLDTFGARLFREPASGRLDFESEFIVQAGHISASLAPSAPKLRVSSGFVHAEAGFTARHSWSPRLALEFDYASGDGRGPKLGRFDTLFGMRRADLAPSGLYNTVARTNIISLGLRAEAAPSKRLDAFAAYRPMWLASATDSFATTGVRDAAGLSGTFAGHQLEARVRYWLVPKRLRLEWDGLIMAKGRFLADAPNAPPRGTTVYNSFNATVSF